LRETWCFSLNVNGPTPFLTNLVGHEQKKVENPWSRLWSLLANFSARALFLQHITRKHRLQISGLMMWSVT